MEYDALGGSQLRHFNNQKNGAGFVVGPHHRDDGDTVIQQGLVFVHVDAPHLVHFQFMDDYSGPRFQDSGLSCSLS